MASETQFGAHTTATEIAEAFPKAITQRTFIITGVSPNSIGASTAQALASQKPARLILAGRSLDKLEVTIDSLRASYAEVTYIPLLLDLSSLPSVRAAADSINSSVDISKIHGLINCAGVMAVPDQRLVDGIELTFATNHVGHFLFTNLLAEKLIAAAQASETPVRVVNVTSFGHLFSPIRFSDWNLDMKSKNLPEKERPLLDMIKTFYDKELSEVGYDGIVSYAQSKTANILFSVSLNQKLHGKYGVESFAVHPGSVDTNINQHFGEEEFQALQERLARMGIPFSVKTREEGASTQVLALVDPTLGPVDLSTELAKGVYLADCSRNEDGCAPHAKNLNDAHKLWSLSEELVKQKFEF
jgi:NAD(P)-dependent dehydrogenase (short-subunit alcohol dehydrogenase family)